MLKSHRLLLTLLLATSSVLVVGCKSDPPAAEPTTTEATDAPDPQQEVDVPDTPGGKYTVAVAKRNGKMQVYSEADTSKKQQTLDSPRMTDTDPPKPVALVMLVKDQKPGWLQVWLPVRPNGTTGWVRTDDFKTRQQEYRIEANLGAFRLKAFKGDEQIFDAPIAVAEQDTPTPGGTYYTTELLQPPNPNGDYGKYAIGLSGFSETKSVTDNKNFGNAQLGIHGTNKPELIGKRVSHGCIRLKNEDIDKLVNFQMPLGTPVIINP